MFLRLSIVYFLWAGVLVKKAFCPCGCLALCHPRMLPFQKMSELARTNTMLHFRWKTEVKAVQRIRLKRRTWGSSQSDAQVLFAVRFCHNYDWLRNNTKGLHLWKSLSPGWLGFSFYKMLQQQTCKNRKLALPGDGQEVPSIALTAWNLFSFCGPEHQWPHIHLGYLF